MTALVKLHSYPGHDTIWFELGDLGQPLASEHSPIGISRLTVKWDHFDRLTPLGFELIRGLLRDRDIHSLSFDHHSVAVKLRDSERWNTVVIRVLQQIWQLFLRPNLIIEVKTAQDKHSRGFWFALCVEIEKKCGFETRTVLIPLATRPHPA